MTKRGKNAPHLQHSGDYFASVATSSKDLAIFYLFLAEHATKEG